jgi:hypothetical protein
MKNDLSLSIQRPDNLGLGVSVKQASISVPVSSNHEKEAVV